MLLSKTAIVAWNSSNKNRYISLGYKYTKMRERFLVNVNDLPPKSSALVVVKCDCCGKIMVRRYVDYLSGHDAVIGDACFDCCQIKREHTNLERYGVKCSAQNEEVRNKYFNSIREKYGVDYYFQTEEFKIKLKQVSLEKYGTEHPMQNEEVKQKMFDTNMERYGNKCFLHTEEGSRIVKETNLKKYGYENIGQSPEILAKRRKTLYKNGKVPTSKQQLAIYDMLLEEYGSCELNYPEGQYSLDCAFNINDTWVNVEYDGLYWHQGKEEYDAERDKFLIKNGYKVLRIKANRKDELPTEEQLKEAIDYLVKGNHSYNEINMNI